MKQLITSIQAPSGNPVSEIAKMLENVPDKLLLIQRIRLSRLKLGSVLERFESFEPDPSALEQLNEHSDNIALEIDTLIESIRNMMGR